MDPILGFVFVLTLPVAQTFLELANSGQIDRHELMEFLKGGNINSTQNNINASIPSPFENDLTAYIDGRMGDISAHETSKFAANEHSPTDFPASESMEEDS